ncbi:MAG: DedA family protein [Gemmatimonadaceae bacterium]|nr:DedA family protein [Gemmatimonadaceae bacterium]
MLEWIVTLIAAGGVWGVFALMAIENIVLPMPSELIMPLAGYAASRGSMTLGGVILFGALGGTLGALPMFYAARLLGRDRGREWIVRHGRWLLLSERQLDRAAKRFEDRGATTVAVSQLLPGVRGLIAIPAGFAGMDVFLFLATNFAGTIIWCAGLAVLGKLLGPGFSKVDHLFGPIGWVVLAAIAVGIAFWVVRRKRAAR